MPTQLSVSNFRRPISAAVLLVLFAIVSVVLAGARTRLASRNEKPSEESVYASPPMPATAISAATASPQQRERQPAEIETELLTITANGFEPSEITRPKGKFLLMIENRSGLRSLSLRLSTESGVHVRDIRVRREDRDWHQVVDFEPGRYLVTELNHPAWSFVLTITR